MYEGNRMKMILRRKDNTSIFCPTDSKRNVSSPVKTKGIELSIACALIAVGLFIMIFGQ